PTSHEPGRFRRMTEATYFRRGFGLKSEIAGVRSADYHSHLIEALRAGGYRLAVGRLTFRLAKEFGFCYGVDRAVDYAYESRLTSSSCRRSGSPSRTSSGSASSAA